MPNTIAFFSSKGGVGKSSLALNFALDYDYGIAVNERYHIYDNVRLIAEADRLVPVPSSQAFPTIPDEFGAIFDLGGSLEDSSAVSVQSALEQAKVVIIPVDDELKSIMATYHTIIEVRETNPNIILVANKLQKYKNEAFTDWKESRQYLNVRDQLWEMTGMKYPTFPMKHTMGFNAVFEQEMSLHQMVERGGFGDQSYRIPANQVKDLYEHLEKNYG